MSNKKIFDIVGPVLLSFVYALTSPIIYVYFVSLISSRIMAIVALISTALARKKITYIKNSSKDTTNSSYLCCLLHLLYLI